MAPPPVSERRSRGRRPGARNELRIIGGRWRGRRLSFLDAPGLRPTPDRVRETLFNWLQALIPGARCLDLYAGSGALGFEAASRGAGEVVMVERKPQVCARLRENARRLGAEVNIVQACAQAYLRAAATPFDVVFLDPPFHQGLVAASLRALVEGGLVRPGGRVYIEAEAGLGEPPLPAGWTLLRSKRAGEVGYHLAEPGQ